MRRLVLAFVLVLVAAGCALSTRTEPMPWSVRALLPNLTPKQAIARAVERMPGWTLQRETEHSVVFSQPCESFGCALVYGSRYDAVPAAEVQFTVWEMAGGAMVSATATMVTNPGSAFERRRDVTRAQEAHLRELLNGLY